MICSGETITLRKLYGINKPSKTYVYSTVQMTIKLLKKTRVFIFITFIQFYNFFSTRDKLLNIHIFFLKRVQRISPATSTKHLRAPKIYVAYLLRQAFRIYRLLRPKTISPCLFITFPLCSDCIRSLFEKVHMNRS